MKLRYGARTDVGRVREQNEDSYGFSPEAPIAPMGMLAIVCDGMGGHAAGEVASRLAVDTIISSYYANTDEQRSVALDRAFVQANRAVYAQGRGTMGTTGVAALLLHDDLYIANVGDSRAYLIRDGAIQQVSHDHSLVADQVAAGVITPEQARVSMIKNVITRALGHQAQVSVDLFRLPLQVGDIVLLCSDGLHGLVTDDELNQIATAHGPDEAAQRLVALANERGGNDNITVALMYVDALDESTNVGNAQVEPLADDAQPAPHERITAKLERTTRPLPLTDEPSAAPSSDTQELTTLLASPTPAEQPDDERPPTPIRSERPLGLLGLLLSLILFSALLFVILNARPDLLGITSLDAAPTSSAPIVTSVPVPTAVQTTTVQRSTPAPTLTP